MKKIKLFLVTLIGLFILSSCSSDDSNSNSNQDQIIGVWKPIKALEVTPSGTYTYNYSSCEQQSRYTFSTNGNFDFFDYNDNSGTCSVDDVGFISGTWERINDTQIKISNIYQSETEIDIPDSVTFPNNNLMRVTYGGYYVEFSRVE